MGAVDSAQGMTRQRMSGDPTISRHQVNEYGTITDHLEFSYALMKADDTLFTLEEQIAVERWLTSPKFSSPLIVYDCEHNQRYKYNGLFTSTEWVVAGETYVAVSFTFSVNGSYPYETHLIEIPRPVVQTVDAYGNSVWGFTCECVSDELEEWVYPRIQIDGITGGSSSGGTESSVSHDDVTILPDDSQIIIDYDDGSFIDDDGEYLIDNEEPTIDEVGGGSTSSTSLPTIFKLANLTDNGRQMVLNLSKVVGDTINIDCKNCIISAASGQDITFKDLGWDHVGRIYWPRLKPGENTIVIAGDVDITLEYDSPVKISGGWLV